MKLSCTQENLNRGFNIASHIASKNISLPILSNVLVTAEEGKIKLTTTNLEIGINVQIRGKIEKEGKIAVQARLIADYINSLPSERVDLRLEKENLKVHCGKAETVIKGTPVDEFPLIPRVEKKNSFQIKAKALRKAIIQTLFAAASDESRPEISGVYMKISKNEMVLAATDSYRLTEKKVKLEKSEGSNEGIIIPARTLQELNRILGDEVDLVDIYVSENQILFSFDGIEMVSRLIEGQYPDYNQIIPKDHKTRVVVNTQDFIKIVKTTSLFCKPGINDVSLEFLPEGRVVVSASNTQIGENISTIEANVEGEKNNIVFNYRYLLDGLSSIDAEEVIVELMDSTNPALIKSKGSDNHLYIIMPIRQ